MKDLKYITNGEPHHKPKVFFGCHPDDLTNALPMLSEDILRYSNCVIWYADEENTFENSEEMETILDDMQLLVLAVTDRFLTQPSEAKDIMLPYALATHIPVLPIALEPKLGRRFNKACASIQIIRKFVTDPTETPYEDVLKSFLNSVLVSDELAQKVRNAFDAYIFLSYRKMDRKHAKRLMRLIHENKEFRDIAIWYDEYLVPGEDYHDAIEDAFKKSSLFALAVTPNILAEGNFVKETEYKRMARARYLAAHDESNVNNEDKFEIVPVELYEKGENEQRTDMTQLAADYPDIPEVEDEQNLEKTNAAFISALERVGKMTSDGTAQHRFFIGLAYLCGIDVEPDFSRALDLLTSAAEDKEPCFEATEKLVDMYSNGEGVAVDACEARRWQKILVEQYQIEYEKNYSPDEHRGFGTKYFKSMLKLSDLYRQAGNINKAIEWVEKADVIARCLEKEVGIRESKRDWAMAANRLGDLYKREKKYAKALDYYLYALDIYKDFVKEIATTRARRDLSVSYERIGDLVRKILLEVEDSDGLLQSYRLRGILAEDCYQKAYEIRQKLYDESHKPSARRDLSAILTKLGNMSMDKKDINSAREYYNRALAYDCELAEELKTRQSRDDYAVSLMKMGKVHRISSEYAQAIEMYLLAKEIYCKLKEESTLPRYWNNYALCCEKLASAYKHNGQPEKAEEQFFEAIAIREAANDGSPDARNCLAVTYFNYASFKKEKTYYMKARAIWEQLSCHFPEYKRYIKKVDKYMLQY